MRIGDRQRVDGETLRVELTPENVDDLWHLSHILEPADRVSGDTTRRIQRDDDALRDTGGEREHLSVTLSVTDVEFGRFANRLRVGGEIVSCSREDQLGHHHTINVEVHDELTVKKVFAPDQLSRLEEAEAAAENADVVVATVEEGEAHVHTVAQYGTEERFSKTAPTGKGDYAQPRTELFADLGMALSRMSADAIILAGPGFTKQDAKSYIDSNYPEVAEKISMVDTASVGDRGVHEVLKRGAVDAVQEETRISREADLIDELMEGIATDEKVAYGVSAVGEAAEFGAVETLMIVDNELRAARRGEQDWEQDIDSIIESVEQQGGEVVILSGEFDPGQRLRNLGGVAALLRYRLS
ncbi:MAG: putative translation factor pelota [Haloquadratum sp. J07HQX50]|nr:MAG: putative translation factor pelota [Haloquadratum sp. J07HQX50]